MILDTKQATIELKKLLDKVSYDCEIFDMNEKEILQDLIMTICEYGKNKGYY